jgi:YceI-like domain
MNNIAKRLLLPMLLGVLFSVTTAQVKYQLASSDISFFSKAPLEDIEAHNKEAKGIIDWTSRNFTFRIPIKSFVFKKSLMQEHFNENYMESTKFPNATFKGIIEGDFDLTKNGTYSVTASGELDIHGVKQSRKIVATIEVKDKGIKINCKFSVKVADHKIEIPTLVFNKIAEEVEVTVQSELIKL